jgi:predicted nucleotidyltransferase
MGLLKLSQRSSDDKTWAQKKAVEVLNSIPSQNLILEAYLFGSAVNGVFTPDSDLDLLVVVKDESAIKQLQKEVYSPRFADIAIDWIFKTEPSFQERKDYGGVCFEAFHYGKKMR